MYILYFEKYKLIIITFSRCWSKTLINWSAKIHNITIKTHNDFILNKNICLNTVENIDDYLIFCDVYIIVRNPYDRLISSIISHHNNDHYTFNEFVNINKDWNFKYNDPLIINIMNKKKCNILYFENLKNDLQNICVKHKIDILPEGNNETKYIDIDDSHIKVYDMKLINFINNCPNYKYFYNEEIITKVYNIFKDDFKLFNFNINIGELCPDL